MTSNDLEFQRDNDKMYSELKHERQETLKLNYMNNNRNEIGELIDALFKHFENLKTEDHHMKNEKKNDPKSMQAILKHTEKAYKKQRNELFAFELDSNDVRSTVGMKMVSIIKDNIETRL